MNVYIVMLLVCVLFIVLGFYLFAGLSWSWDTNAAQAGGSLGVVIGCFAAMLLMVCVQNYGTFVPQETKTYEIISIENNVINGVSEDKKVEKVKLEEIDSYSSKHTTLVVEEGYTEWGFVKYYGQTQYRTQ